MNQLNSDLEEVLKALAAAKKLRGQLDQLDTRLRDRNVRLEALRSALDKERMDVRKLEGFSLSSIYHTILSSKQERLAEEQADVLRAKLSYDQCRTEVRQLTAARERIQESLDDLAGAEQKHEDLLKRKEALLLAGAGPAAQELLALTEQHAALLTQLREIDEASSAGSLALESLDKMVKCLGSAKSYGTWDMLGGGLIATSLKHSELNQAKEHAEQAQDDLFHFQRELKDIWVAEDLEIAIDGFETFADYLLDGLLFDWIVQSKIQKSCSETEEVKRQVKDLVEDLGARRASVQKQLIAIDAEKERCIAEA